MSGIYGADVSAAMSVNDWKNLMNERSVSFGIVRCYQSLGQVDPNAATSVANGKAACLNYVDVYHYPCLAVDAQTQVEQAVAALQNTKFRRYWFDVETLDAGWSTTNQPSNSKFLSQLISAAYALGQQVGVYTSAGQWSTIIGDNSCRIYPLWYSNWSPPCPSFDDFVPFGGWTAPYMKQFAGNECHAGVSYDGDWTPNL